MMEGKLLEVRDSMTFIPVLAVKVSGEDGYLMRAAGFGNPMIYLVHLIREKCAYDPYFWGDRTMQTAHLYIAEHFDELPNEDVVDVEFILGEKSSKKVSQRHGD